MTTQIQRIHESDMFGIFIEMGLGNPVSSKLCEVSGASNTIFCAENPYNDKYSRKLFGIEGRIVSLEAVHKIMNSDHVTNLWFKDSKINTVFVSSFQIGNRNDKSTHGYVGIKYKDEVKYYHISNHASLNRGNYIHYIADTCLDLLDISRKDAEYFDIDGAWDSNLNPLLSDTLEFIGKDKGETFTYIQDGKILRLEDLLRSSNDGLIVYKGSFNPITNAHLKLMSESSKQFPNYKTCFSISLNTFGKGVSDYKNIIERIRIINKLGYGVLIYNGPKFDEIHLDLMLKYNKEIVYVMGSDTLARYLHSPCNPYLKNRKFIVFHRKGYEIKEENLGIVTYLESNEPDSSTQVREAIKTNSLYSVKEMIPADIYDDLIGNKLFT